ncbi:Presenilin-1, partial [Dissophora ornata]
MSALDTPGETAPPGQGLLSQSNPSPPGADSSQSATPIRNNTIPEGNRDSQVPTQGQAGPEGQATVANSGDDQPCQICDAFPARFQCSACQSVRYCSQECQAADWRAHYRECSEIVAAKKEEQEGSSSNPDVEQGSRARASQRRSNVPGPMGGDLGDEAENVRAVANQPRRRPREPRRRPQLTPEQKAAYEQAERIADMKFYMLQIYKIIKPVVICICLSILWVKISLAGSDYRPTQSSYTVYTESSTSTVSQNILGSLANAGIIIGQIVIVTIIIVILFKRGHIKVLIGFFMVVVALLLGFMGYVLVLNLIQVLRIPLDYVTMSFALWNFAVTGLISVFWKGPMWLQQVYLTVMSSLMAFSLTGLAEWTTWMLLALLVIWDLIAVLCPFGPLKILVESSRDQNQDVPALLYTVNAVWFMASPPNSILERETNRSKEGANVEDVLVDGDNSHGDAYIGGHSRATGREGGASISSSHNSGLDASFGAGSTVALVPATSNESVERGDIELRERIRSGGPTNPEGSPSSNRAGRSPSVRQAQNSDAGMQPDSRIDNTRNGDDEDDDGGGLKLGLGDFVFYSVLIARA